MTISVEKRFLSLLLVFAIVFLLLPLSPMSTIEAFAATVDGFNVSGLSVDYSAENSSDTATKNGENGLVIKASGTTSGCSSSTKTTTVTLTNTFSEDAVLSFGYSQSGTGEVKFSPDVGADGSYSTTLSAGGSITITVKSGSGSGNNITLTLSNIALALASATYDVTVDFDSTLGSVTVDGAAVNSGDVKEGVSASTGVALVATYASGATFFAWIDSDTGETLSTSETYTYKPAKNSTVKAVFTKTDGSSTAWFSAGTATVLYDDLNEAIAAAQQASAAYVVLKSSGILASGTYTIPANIKLLIPYDDDNTHSGSDPDTEKMPSSGWLTPEPFKTLTMADGAVIKVENKASIEVAANHYASHGGKDFGGRPVHYYGHIVMQGKSRIELESGANLYAWGYITGSTDAKVIAKSGSTIYEKMQVADYRGGTATTPITSAGVFPFSQYYIQNVEVREVIQSGANLICHAAIYAYSIQNNTVNFMGADSGNSSPMFALGADSEAVKYYDPTTDRLIVDVSGSFSFNSISLMGYNTKDFVLPLQQNLTINIKSGAVATVNQDIMLQPGCQINIDNGATLKIASGKNVHLMDTAEWGTFCSASPRQLVQITYVPSTSNKLPVTRTLNNDAKVDVNGTVIIEGQIYASAGHASIVSSGKTGVITFTSAVNATTSIKQCKTNDKNGVFEIPMYSVFLTNTNRSSIDTAGTTAGTTYCMHCGVWQTITVDAAVDPTCTETGLTEGSHYTTCGCVIEEQIELPANGHKYDAVVTAPTCTEKGYTTHTCSVCGDTYKDSEVAATGHDYDEGVVTTDPTCTNKGVKTFTCATCGDSYTEDVAALGHTEGPVVVENNVDPTCTSTGSYDTVVYCTVCGEELSRVTTTVDALGHTEGEVVKENVVAPTCTEDGSHDEVTYCTVCNKELTRVTKTDEKLGHKEGAAVEENRVNATCTADGSYDIVVYCTECDAELSRTSVTVDALNHNYESVVTSPTCTEKGYTTHTCSRCGDSYTDSETEATGHHFEHGVCVDGDVKLGDSNGDGDITTADVTILNAFILGKVELDEEELILLDINGDGKITTADVALLNAINKGKIQL